MSDSPPRRSGPVRGLPGRRLWIASCIVVAALVAAAVLVPLNLAPTSADSATQSSAQVAPGPPNPAPTLGAVAPTVVAIGDSIMDGHGLVVDQSWPELLAAQRGWRLTDLAADGAGFVSPGDAGGTFIDQVKQAIPLNPAVVIVSASSNDLGKPSAAIAAEMATALAMIHSLLPNAQLITVSSTWGSTSVPDQLVQINDQMAAATKVVDGIFLDVGEPFTNHLELMQSDDVHPNFEGQLIIVDLIGKQLNDFGIRV